MSEITQQDQSTSSMDHESERDLCETELLKFFKRIEEEVKNLTEKGLYKRINYRIWDGKMGVRRDWATLACNPNIEMLSTGIKDKHGKEIYEGDIVTHSNTDIYSCYSKERDIYIVKHGFFIERVGDGNQRYPSATAFGCKDDEERVTVIGNIYENPELLK